MKTSTKLPPLILLCLLWLVSNAVFAKQIVLDNIVYTVNNDDPNTVTLTEWLNCSGDVTIPETIEYDSNSYTVTAIGDGAFYNCKNITSVTIGDNVETIGKRAFDNCLSLTSVTIGENVKEIGDSAFEFCEQLTSVDIPGNVKKLGIYAFYKCSSLTSFRVPKSVEEIGVCIVACCNELEEIIVEEGNPNYDSRDDCNAIISKENVLIAGCKTTTIPDNITSIGKYAFRDCDALTSFIIPENVTIIDDYAFYVCSNLTSITIGSKVMRIGESAFSNCSALTKIICHATTPPSCGSYAFDSKIISKCTVIVPKDSKEYYMTADVWKDCTNILEDENINILLGETGYATYCCEYDLDFSNIEGVKAYIAESYENDCVYLAEVTQVPKETGIILIGEENTEYNVPIIESAEISENFNGNMLVGTNVEASLLTTVDGKTNYVLANGNSGVGFYRAKEGKINAHKAYLQLPASTAQGVSSFRIGIGNTTGIEQTIMQPAPQTDNIYNLNGQRVSNPQRGGIYIVNGKKKLF